MAVELDHSFTTSKPIDESFAADHRPRARRPGRPGRQRARDDRPGRREGRDPGQDGRDVDEVHRHGRGHREGRGRPPRGADDQVARGRRAGARQRDRHLRAQRRRRDASTRNAQITGKAASMGEGVVAGRARRAHHGLHDEARATSDAMARVVMREVREGEVPYDGGTAVQEDADRPAFRGNGPDDYVCVECGNVLAESMHEHADDLQGPRQVRALLDDQRLGDRRARPRPQAPLRASSAVAVAGVGRRAVAVDRRDPDHRRVAHGRRRRGRAARRGRRARAGARRSRSPWRPGRGRGRRSARDHSRHSAACSSRSKPTGASAR